MDLHILITSSVVMMIKKCLQEIEVKIPTQTKFIATTSNIDLLFRYL